MRQSQTNDFLLLAFLVCGLLQTGCGERPTPEEAHNPRSEITAPIEDLPVLRPQGPSDTLASETTSKAVGLAESPHAVDISKGTSFLDSTRFSDLIAEDPTPLVGSFKLSTTTFDSGRRFNCSVWHVSVTFSDSKLRFVITRAQRWDNALSYMDGEAALADSNGKFNFKSQHFYLSEDGEQRVREESERLFEDLVSNGIEYDTKTRTARLLKETSNNRNYYRLLSGRLARLFFPLEGKLPKADSRSLYLDSGSVCKTTQVQQRQSMFGDFGEGVVLSTEPLNTNISALDSYFMETIIPRIIFAAENYDICAVRNRPRLMQLFAKIESMGDVDALGNPMDNTPEHPTKDLHGELADALRTSRRVGFTVDGDLAFLRGYYLWDASQKYAKSTISYMTSYQGSISSAGAADIWVGVMHSLERL